MVYLKLDTRNLKYKSTTRLQESKKEKSEERKEGREVGKEEGEVKEWTRMDRRKEDGRNGKE